MTMKALLVTIILLAYSAAGESPRINPVDPNTADIAGNNAAPSPIPRTSSLQSFATYSDLAATILRSSENAKFNEKMNSVKGIEDLQDLDDQGNSALHLVCMTGDYRMFVRLLKDYPQLLFQRNNKERTPLMIAARNGHVHARNEERCFISQILAAADNLMDEMTDDDLLINDVLSYIDAADEDGKTALIHAAEKGNEEAVYILLKKKANANLVDIFERNALFYAVMRCHYQTFVTIVNNFEGFKYIEVDVDGKSCYESALADGCRNILAIIRPWNPTRNKSMMSNEINKTF